MITSNNRKAGIIYISLISWKILHNLDLSDTIISFDPKFLHKER